MSKLQRILPLVCVVSALLYVLTSLMRPAPNTGEFDLKLFAQVPVSGEGRVKPLDTVARNSLMMLSGRRTVLRDGQRIEAIEWYADVVAKPQISLDDYVFRIDHPDVVEMIGLDDSDRKRFSFNEIMAEQEEIVRQASLASKTKAKKRDPFQRAVLMLYNQLDLYLKLQLLQQPYAVPPLSPDTDWRPLGFTQGEPDASAFLGALSAYADGDADGFNNAVAEHLAAVEAVLPSVVRRSSYEVVFSRAKPFYVASVLYVVAFLLGCFGLLLSRTSRPDWSRSLGSAVLGVLVVTLILHTIAIISRIYLQGRPPVTNLYSSAVFIGWTSVLLGLIVERRMRLGLGGIAAALIGFVTLVIAHNLGGGRDTMEMMQAVLDTNFWLATHVVVITIGYAATFFAGALGIAYISMGVLTRSLDRERRKTLGGMIYGVICFAALTSFAGTVLGGIWADQSWGRFWGWDPKENGAALIVLANLIIMHARWGGMIKERGIAVLAVGGNVVTAWSWFGTNMLGVGLHSYGFTESAVFWLALFAVSQLAVMAMGLMPLAVWRSIRAESDGGPAAK